jgi:hypothetical protein
MTNWQSLNWWKKLHAFYGTWRFVTAFIRICHWALFWATWIQSQSSSPVSLILKLSPHLRLGLQDVCSLEDFRLSQTFLIPKWVLSVLSISSSWNDYSNNKWWRVIITKLFTVNFSLTSCYFVLPSPCVQIFSSVLCFHLQCVSFC